LYIYLPSPLFSACSSALPRSFSPRPPRLR